MKYQWSLRVRRAVVLVSSVALVLAMSIPAVATAVPVATAGVASTLHGNITDRATGAGVDGVTVIALRDGGAGVYTPVAQAVTDAGGGYTLSGLGAGLYFYRVLDLKPDHSGGYVGWGDGDATASRFYLTDGADEWGYNYQMAGPDATAPHTTATAPSGWMNGPATVTLSASDDDSGVHHIVSQVGDAVPVLSGNVVEIPVAAQGVTTVRFHAVDHWGNTEAEQSVEVMIDSDAPVMSHNAETLYTAAPEITMSATDAGSGMANITYTLDGAEQVLTEGASATLIVGTTGDHVLDCWATDVAGNTSRRCTQRFTVASSAETGLPPTEPAAPVEPTPPVAGPPAPTPAALVVAPAAGQSTVSTPALSKAAQRRAARRAARRVAARRAALRRAARRATVRTSARPAAVARARARTIRVSRNHLRR